MSSWSSTDDRLTRQHPSVRAAWLACTALIACSLLLAACQRPEPPPVRIGFIGGLSGTVADLGVNGRNGALLAVESLNVRGGPRRYELQVEDDRQDPAHAAEVMDALIRRPVDFVVGPMTSVIAMAVVPQAERAGMVIISPTATTDDLSGKKDLFFRIAADAPTGARQLAAQLIQRGWHQVAVLIDERNRPYSASFARAFGARLRELGGKVAPELSFESQTGGDFSGLAQSLLEGRPHAVLLVAGVGDSALLAQQLRKRDPQIGLAVSPWAANAHFLQLGGRAVEGCIALQALNLEDTSAAYAGFRSLYRERFGEPPGTPAVQAYDAVMVGAAALSEASKNQRPLRDVLAEAGRHWPGLQSDIVFDAYGDTARALHMTEVHDGSFVAVKPVQP